MIAFSCVHCGQRMALTQEEGGKKATCPSCGQAVWVPAGESGPGRRRGSMGTASHARVPPVIQEIHEVATRVEDSPRPALDLGFLAPSQRDDEIGRLGPYRVLGVIGAGGMGVVLRAHDVQLDRVVALKAMLPALAASATARQRFLREARAAAAIQHDRVVTVFQVGEDSGVPFLAMPLLRGESLDACLRREKTVAEPEAVRIAAQTAEGLAAIHDLGLIHRDVKPGNLFLEGDERRVKILDFGLARVAAGDVQLTQEGSIVGSPAFMAPEQATRGPLDARVDLFSLGCVLYLMLTGELPFPGDDALTTLLAVTGQTPRSPQQLRPDLSEGLSGLVMALLAKKPADRPASARAALAAMRGLRTRAAGPAPA